MIRDAAIEEVLFGPMNLVGNDTLIVRKDLAMIIDSPPRFVHGHIVVTGAILFRGVTLPWRFDLWLPKRWADRAYRKSTEIAAEMIRAFESPKGVKVRVLFDAFYLSPTVTKAYDQ